MSPRRRALMVALLAAPARAADGSHVARGRTLVFPRDHGAHVGSSIEWWYATGWLGSEQTPSHGFQVTFFRKRLPFADGPETTGGRFAPRQLLFAHAALTELARPSHRHDARIARWSGDGGQTGPAWARDDDAAVRIGRWSWRRDDAGYHATIDGAFELQLQLARRQPLLLQGDAGFSRKGPDERNASHYYSEPQLAAQARLLIDGREQRRSGSAWLDHEWSDALLHPDAVGWDWIGINLFDGSALTAFQLRRADGSMLWAGGSWREAKGAAQTFAPQALRFSAERHWASPATHARYPVRWRLDTPAGRFVVNALFDAQEVDARRSTGTLYWEGLSELLDVSGRRVGLGYLELTGYGERLRLG